MKEQMIPLNLMRVDSTYQRCVKPEKVKKIADEWDDMLANLVYVSHRSDGFYYVMDGNHTRIAYESIGGEELACRVFEDLTVEQEANLFDRLNTSQKKPTFNERLKAKARAGHPLEKSYFQLLDEANISYELYNGAHGCKIRCHNAIMNVYKKTTYTIMLRALIATRRAADGREEFYQTGLFPGLCSVIVMHPEIDDQRLITLVKKTSSSKLREIADRYRRGIVDGTNSATANYRKAYIDIYNKGLKKNKIMEG